MSSKPLVRIVDDDEDLAEALSFMLESRVWDVVTYNSAEAFLREDAPSDKGCVLLDVRMPGLSGLELQRIMKERGYNLPIIFLTGHGSIDMAVSAVRLGAVDFLQKTGDQQRIIEAVRRAVERSREGFADIDADQFSQNGRWLSLTDREKEIASFLAKYHKSREVAQHLHLSVRTVEVHRARVLKKLGIKTIEELQTVIATVREGGENP